MADRSGGGRDPTGQVIVRSCCPLGIPIDLGAKRGNFGGWVFRMGLGYKDYPCLVRIWCAGDTTQG